MKKIHDIQDFVSPIDDLSLIAATDFTIIDVETTGVDPQIDKIIEIGLIRFINGEMQEPLSTLINPEVMIPCTSTAVNGITDEMVQDSPTIEMVREAIAEYVGTSIPVAHNASFDRSFVNPAVFLEDGQPLLTYHEKRYGGKAEGNGRPWLCTMRLAKHLFPEAPAYGNQVLRYWMRASPLSAGLGAHRAIDDCYVTAEIAKNLMRKALQEGVETPEDLLSLSKKAIPLEKMPRGKHIDVPISEVPMDYLEWAMRIDGMTDMDMDLGMSIEREYNRRQIIGHTAGKNSVPAAFTVPFGDNKGQPIEAVETNELLKISQWITKKNVEKFFAMRDAIEAIVESRKKESSLDAPQEAQKPEKSSGGSITLHRFKRS